MSLSTEEINNLSALLLSSDDNNTQVAFAILKPMPFPKELITEVFAIFKITKNKILKKEAKAILEEHGSEELQMAMAMRYPLSSTGNSEMSVTEKTIQKNIIHYTHNNELDGTKLAKALYKKFGFGATYLLTSTPKSQRKEMLKMFINETSFKLNGKALTQFPPELFEFTELTEIDLSGNKISSIPKQIEVFQNLKTLRVNNNKLASIHKNILKLSKLEELYLNNNNFTKQFPEIIFDMPQLKKLDIKALRSNWVHYEDLPEGIYNLKNLEELSLSDMLGRAYLNYPQISFVTGNPIDLSPLAIANAAYAQGDKRPISYLLKFGDTEIIRQILHKYYDSATKTMNFSGIYLEHLPKELSEFDIEQLILSQTKIGSRYGRRVEYYGPFDDLVEMDLQRLAVISELKNLNLLDLSNCEISVLPDLSNLQQLTTLKCNYNDFVEFPREILQLKNLEKMELCSTTYHNFKKSPAPFLKEFTVFSKLTDLKIHFSGMTQDTETWTNLLKGVLPNCKFRFW